MNVLLIDLQGFTKTMALVGPPRDHIEIGVKTGAVIATDSREEISDATFQIRRFILVSRIKSLAIYEELQL